MVPVSTPALATLALAALRRAPDDPLHGIRVLGLAEAIGLAAGLLMHVAAARFLSPADYGRFAVLLAFELGLLILAAGGVPQALRRLVGMSLGNLPEALRWALRVQLPLGIALGLLLALGAGPFGALLGDGGLEDPLRLLGLDVALRCGLMETYLALLNGARRHVLQGGVAVTFFLARLGGVAFAVAHTGTLVGAVLGMIAASTVATTLAAAFVHVLRRGVEDTPDAQFSSQALAWIRLAPGYEALVALVAPVNLWLVKAGVPDPTLVGRYAAAFAMAQAASAPGRALVGATFAPLAAAFARGSTARACRITSRATRAMVGVLAPVCVLAVIRGEALIGLLYGEEYRGSGALAGLLFAGTGSVAALSVYGGVLGAAGRLGTRLRIVVPLTLGSVLVTLSLIRLAGPAGAAWALVLTGSAGASAAAGCVARAFGPFFPWTGIARMLVAAAVMAGVALLVDPPRSVIGMALDSAAAGLIYTFILVMLGEIDGQSLRPGGSRPTPRRLPKAGPLETGVRR